MIFLMSSPLVFPQNGLSSSILCTGAIHREDIEFFGDSITAYGHGGGDIGYTANVTFIENTNTIIEINYNYGTQFWTPMGEKIQEMKRAIYTTVLSP